jgi:glucosamine-6-phosphate deaminase
MTSNITPKDILEWCKIPYNELEKHPRRKVPFRICKDSAEMGSIMARELVEIIQGNNKQGKPTHAILPCGPLCWYKPFTELVNREQVSLKHLVVFHMDECLDWQGKIVPKNHPQNFQNYMEKNFYEPVASGLQVPEGNRNWLYPDNVTQISQKILSTRIDITYGGWGQDGHVAFNQARRNPYSQLTIDDVRNSTARIQDNNLDTVIALAHRSFGTAYQLVAPMSVTLGVKECLSAKRVRLFSDTGAWKQTALRIALFGPLTPDFPMTLLQEHPDALLTATVDTSKHPISEHPEWDFGI